MAAKSLLPTITKICCLNTRNFITGTLARTIITKNTKFLLGTVNSSQRANYTRQYSSGVINDIPVVTYEEIKQLTKQPEKLLIDKEIPLEIMATRTLIRQLNKISSLNAVRGLTTTSNLASRVINQKIYCVTKTSGIGVFKQYSTTRAENNIPVATYEEIKQLTNKQLLIDVREPKELEETGKIGPSINIPMKQLEQELGTAKDNSDFKLKYGRDKPDENSEIIFHCRSGKRAQKAAKIARNLGYKNVKNYKGSWLDWAKNEGLPK